MSEPKVYDEAAEERARLNAQLKTMQGLRDQATKRSERAKAQAEVDKVNAAIHALPAMKYSAAWLRDEILAMADAWVDEAAERREKMAVDILAGDRAAAYQIEWESGRVVMAVTQAEYGRMLRQMAKAKGCDLKGTLTAWDAMLDQVRRDHISNSRTSISTSVGANLVEFFRQAARASLLDGGMEHWWGRHARKLIERDQVVWDDAVEVADEAAA